MHCNHDDHDDGDQETQQHCSVCEEVITGTYYSLGDKIYCEKDYMVIIIIISSSIIIIITIIIIIIIMTTGTYNSYPRTNYIVIMQIFVCIAAPLSSSVI